jgi:hypothetical protein
MIASFVQREIERIHDAICNPNNANRRAELHAAQQALSWALDPTGFRSPLGTIMGIQEGQEGCLAQPHPVPFSDTHAPDPSFQ